MPFLRKSQILIFHDRPDHFPGLFVQKCLLELKKSKIEIFSETTVVVVKPFQGRTNISSTFLFPRLDCGINISDFEKIAFFDSRAILGVFSPPRRPFFAARTFLKISLLFEKKSKNEKFLADFLEILLSYPGIFFGPSGTIQSLRNRIFRKKRSKKVPTTSKPPLGQLTA